MYNFFSRFPESEKQFSLASEICDSPEMRVWLFQLRAQMKNFEGKPEEGGDLARRGLHELETAEKAGTENGRVFVFLKRRLYGHLAESYRFRGDFEKDALYCEKALEVMDAYFGGVGLDKTDADSFPQQKTYAIGHKIGNRIGFMDGNIVLRESSVMKRFLESIPEQEYGWTYYHMGESAFVRRDLEAARKYARISQDCFAAVKDIWAEAFPRNLLGHVLYMSGDSEGALAESLFAYERLAPLNGKDSAGGSLVWILFLYREMGDTEGEREVLCRMRELYNDEGVGVLLNEADALEDSPWINPTVLSKRMVSVLRRCEHN